MLPKLRSIYAKWDILLFVAILLIILLIRYNVEILDGSMYNQKVRNVENASLVRGTGGTEGCQGSKKQKIVFLKTHKVGKCFLKKIILFVFLIFQCASSSLQNIFFRFGEKYELNFVLPYGGHQLYGKYHSI